MQAQLAGASDDAILLLAELMYIHLLITRTMHGHTKRNRITENILALMNEPVAIRTELESALDHGWVNPGTFYMTRLDVQIRYLVEFGTEWTRLSATEQQALLQDGWRMKDFASRMMSSGSYGQMAALLHLLFPDDFEPIVSPAHKELIATRFAEAVSLGEDDLDRRLLQIRHALSTKYGTGSFYDEPYRSKWQHTGGAWSEFIRWAKRVYEEPDFETRERIYKLEVAAVVAEARTALLTGGDWRPALQRAFRHTANKLTNWRTHDTFLKWLAAESRQDDSDDRAEAARSGRSGPQARSAPALSGSWSTSAQRNCRAWATVWALRLSCLWVKTRRDIRSSSRHLSNMPAS